MKNKTTLNYRIIGEGQPVVFLHGFLEDNQMWKKILPHLTQIQVIAIELPGHGDSPLLPPPLSLPKMAEAVKDILVANGIHFFSIVGHSMGGYVALYLAEMAELTVDKLVLFHSHPWADSADKKRNRTRAAELVKQSKSFFIREAITDLYAPENRAKLSTEIEEGIAIAKRISGYAISQSLIAMRDRESKVTVLKKFKEKVFIIQGEFDPIINTQDMAEIAKEAKNNFYLIQNIGHMGYNEAPKRVVSILTKILD